MKKNIAIFASGTGTNAENIIRYFHDSESGVVSLLLSNKVDAPALERARRLGVPCAAFGKEEWASGEAVLSALREAKVDFIVLAGFLLRVPEPLLRAYPGRIVNIHPSLLPKFGGKGMYGGRVHEAVLAAGERESGITIHYINERYDEGGVIFQASCPVLPDDTPETLARRVHELEYRYYPEVIEKLLSE